MIVYRKSEHDEAAQELVGSLLGLASRVEAGSGHEDAVELLMESGRFESAVVDAIFPGKDGVNELSAALRRASLLAGHALVSSWNGASSETAARANGFRAEMRAIAAMRMMPPVVRTRVPEGYAHYGLFPEVYAASARAFFDEHRPSQAVCIGLRSAGASLSSVVAASLESFGCLVRSFTVRPRGHPFRRKALFTPELEETVRALRDGWFLVVDEGPGLSGSSFASVTRRLSRLGVRDERIALFPSWQPDGGSFISADARLRWGRHARYCSSFEQVWADSGRLAESAGVQGPLRDLSAGMWRGLFYGDGDFPATHPWHERRKYLASVPGLKGARMLKFAGHGRYGRGKLRRAELLSEAGFAAPVEGLASGFLVSEFLPGRPVADRELNQILMDSMARYSALLKRSFPTRERMGFDEFMDMIRRNITLGLGSDWAALAERLGPAQRLYEGSEPVELDGRMLPHEWLLTNRGYRKADCLDHCADQFFPSCQDIAWDLAMASVEFDMNPMEQGYFLGRYSAASGDTVGADRLRLQTIAYLAFRLGYCSFASEELACAPDGARFKELVHRYSARLKRELLWLEDR